jgi:hypothetical protein
VAHTHRVPPLTPESTVSQYNAYNDSLAYTRGGKLVLESTADDWDYSPFDPTLTRTYQTAMLQTWNKLCFTGGYFEVSAKMPGRHDVGGLWPAAWLMGNLGRATFPASTDRIWPFNYDQCPSKADRRANQFGTQELNACDHPEMGGRGAPEIDMIEVMPGTFDFDYQGVKVDTEACEVPDPAVLRNIVSRTPMVSTSVQAGPGQPAYAIERPYKGCLPAPYTAAEGSTQVEY